MIFRQLLVYFDFNSFCGGVPLAVWGLPALGDFHKTGEMTFFNHGGFPQCWGNAFFSFLILTMKIGCYEAIVFFLNAKFHTDYVNISFMGCIKNIFGINDEI